MKVLWDPEWEDAVIDTFDTDSIEEAIVQEVLSYNMIPNYIDFFDEFNRTRLEAESIRADMWVIPDSLEEFDNVKNFAKEHKPYVVYAEIGYLLPSSIWVKSLYVTKDSEIIIQKSYPTPTTRTVYIEDKTYDSVDSLEILRFGKVPVAYWTTHKTWLQVSIEEDGTILPMFKGASEASVLGVLLSHHVRIEEIPKEAFESEEFTKRAIETLPRKYTVLEVTLSNGEVEKVFMNADKVNAASIISYFLSLRSAHYTIRETVETKAGTFYVGTKYILDIKVDKYRNIINRDIHLSTMHESVDPVPIKE